MKGTEPCDKVTGKNAWGDMTGSFNGKGEFVGGDGDGFVYQYIGYVKERKIVFAENCAPSKVVIGRAYRLNTLVKQGDNAIYARRNEDGNLECFFFFTHNQLRFIVLKGGSLKDKNYVDERTVDLMVPDTNAGKYFFCLNDEAIAVTAQGNMVEINGNVVTGVGTFNENGELLINGAAYRYFGYIESNKYGPKMVFDENFDNEEKNG